MLTNRKRGGVSVLISDKAQFRTRSVITDKVYYYIIVKKSMSEKKKESLMCMHPTTEHQNT